MLRTELRSQVPACRYQQRQKRLEMGHGLKTASKDIYATSIYTPDAAGILVKALGKAIRDVKQRLGFMPKRSWQGWRRHGVHLLDLAENRSACRNL